jgi:para-aminobenzoate synthetase / 4-amino-4-deoxychorismate lyase
MTRWHAAPADLYAVVEQTPASLLLESAPPADSTAAPPTRLFTEPLRICIANQLSDLPSLFAEIERAVAEGLYAAGYFTYECGAFFEPTAAPTGMQGKSLDQPLAWFGIYREPYSFDHQAGKFLNGDEPALAAAQNDDPDVPLDWTLALTEEQYSQRIEAIHEAIRAGDVYQLNFTAPIRVRTSGSSAALYARLRRLQPAPYGAFLHTQPNHRILSFSPELFFRIESEIPHETPVPHPCDVLRSRGWESTTTPTRRITTRPMKGTAPRGRTTAEDRAIADWLRNDPKNRSENVMIVDLLRNDLGRLCQFGSVTTSNLFAVERYPTLWQMTSTISGELRPEAGFQDIFRALFPCGSITGAPKIRAMQLLSQLEQQPRGIYTGAIGFFSKRETVFNVAIRTLTLNGDQGAMGVGSGIVIDSEPAAEYRECLLKAEFLTRSVDRQPKRFSLIETMLWDGAYPLIELHLDRLEDSADYFGFACNRERIRTNLEQHTRQFADRSPRKVRLLFNAEDDFEITDEVLPADRGVPRIARVTIAPQRTDPADAMLYHKTTYRPLYGRAHLEATQAGFDDVLFLNQRGEVTEGAISNVFVEKDGRWYTPPVACGLLAGVYRRHLLATRPEIEERVLFLNDLRQADGVYLANAVRGLRRAVVVW